VFGCVGEWGDHDGAGECGGRLRRAAGPRAGEGKAAVRRRIAAAVVGGGGVCNPRQAADGRHPHVDAFTLRLPGGGTPPRAQARDPGLTTSATQRSSGV